MSPAQGPEEAATGQGKGTRQRVNRLYALLYSTSIINGPLTPVPAATDISGTGALLSLTDPDAAPTTFCQVSVRLP